MESPASLLRIPPPKRSFLLPLSPHCFLPPPLPTTNPRGASLIARAVAPPDGEKGQGSDEPAVSSPPPPPPPPNKPGGRGAGFGSVADTKRKQRGKESSSVVRRTPIQKPSLLSSAGKGPSPQEQQQGLNESTFLLTWLGLGALILVEGIALAASGFLPAEWDNFFVKYLYPSFTPTVFLFVGGTVTYGVLKYLQDEKTKS